MQPQTAEIEQAIKGLDRRDKLHLIQVLADALQRDQPAPPPGERRIQLDDLLEGLDAIPSESKDDGFSNRDHDTLLYGRRL